jgi:hypothetical protein
MVFRSLGFVILLISLAATTLAETITVDVSITLIDTKRSSINVSYDGKSRQLELAKNLQVEIDGKKSDFTALIPGDTAQVTYDKDKQVITKIVVQREAMLPAEKLPEGWDEIDQRLIFLMVRLADVEARLEAIQQVLDASNRQVSSKSTAAKRADRANEDMDRMGGGPLKWSQFYGMTAEKFFYHPTDRNSTYHTTTVLSQQGPQADNKLGGGVPSSQGLPIHQRPPQFDYIYRSNERAKVRATAEVAELKGRMDQIVARRQQLESEQAGLWVEIAFRSISHFDLDKKSVYRFEPLLANSDTVTRNKAEIMKATVAFMINSLSVISESETNQAKAFKGIKSEILRAREFLSDNYLRLGIDTRDKNSTAGKFALLAKRLSDVASNLTDSYLVSMEGNTSSDSQRKETFRSQLQQSLLYYAQIVLGMDEMVSEMEVEYSFQPNLDKPIASIGKSNAIISATANMQDPSSRDPATVFEARCYSITELNTKIDDIAPWVSADGLEIFWANLADDTDASIWTARRSDKEGKFYDKRRLFDGHGPVLSPDGRHLYFRDIRTEGIFQAVRKSRTDQFSKPQPIPSLIFKDRDPAPRWITDDGLIMYIDMKDAEGVYHCFEVHRDHPDMDWSIPIKTDFKLANLDNVIRVTQVSSSRDKMHLFGVVSVRNDNKGIDHKIGILSRSNPSSRFTNWEPISLPTTISSVLLRPLYVPETKELFFVGHQDLWVMKGYSPKLLIDLQQSTLSEELSNANMRSSNAESRSANLFRGEELPNWSHTEKENIWTLRENEIMGFIAPGASQSHIIDMTRQYKDFELEVMVNCDVDSAGALCIRCQVPSTPNSMPPSGYSIGINGKGPAFHNPPGTVFDFKLTGEARKTPANHGLTTPNKWFKLKVVAMGDQVTVYVDDQLAVASQHKSPALEGYVGLQCQNGKISFKDMFITELPHPKSK